MRRSMLGIVLCLPLALFAKSVVVVDAGSSGTRLHLYQLQGKAVTQVMHVSTRPGLSFFVTENDGGGHEHVSINASSLISNVDSLIDRAMNIMPVPKSTSVYVYASAGLRALHHDTQKKVLRIVEETFKSRGFQHFTAHVITGQEEAKYDWLGVNGAQLIHNPNLATAGVIDAGGKSLELAFVVHQWLPADKPNVVTVHLPNRAPLHLYARSFMGFGENDAMKRIMTTAPESLHVCFPKGTRPGTDSAFDWKRCHQAVVDVFGAAHAMFHLGNIMDASPKDFVALSGLYYTAKFLDHAPWRQWPLVGRQHCGKTWKALKKQYPQALNQYLEYDCMAAVYNEFILSTLLGMQQKRIRFSRNAGWPDGVAIAYALGDPMPGELKA